MAEGKTDAFTLGQHSARLEALEASVQEVRSDVKTILSYIEQGKGSWRTLIGIGGAAVALVEGCHQFFAWLHK